MRDKLGSLVALVERLIDAFEQKDLADVARLLDIQGKSFDAGFVRQWLVAMLGEADERIATWDRLVRSHHRHS